MLKMDCNKVTLEEVLVNLSDTPEVFKDLIFVCSPFAGDVEQNVANAIEYAKAVIANKLIPFVPHLHFTRILDDNDSAQRKLGMALGQAMLLKCKAMWVFGDRLSNGMIEEIKFCFNHDIKVVYMGQYEGVYNQIKQIEKEIHTEWAKIIAEREANKDV